MASFHRVLFFPSPVILFWYCYFFASNFETCANYDELIAWFMTKFQSVVSQRRAKTCSVSRLSSSLYALSSVWALQSLQLRQNAEVMATSVFQSLTVFFVQFQNCCCCCCRCCCFFSYSFLSMYALCFPFLCVLCSFFFFLMSLKQQFELSNASVAMNSTVPSILRLIGCGFGKLRE